MAKLSGKVALVTGASKGIGAEMARVLAADGAAVAVNYAGDEPGARRVSEAIAASDGKAIVVQGSVTDPDDVRRIFEETKAAFGPVDVLVNNAGVYAFAPIEKSTAAEYRRQFDTNVLGVIYATQLAVEQFGNRGGSIINVSSAVVQRTPPGTSIYAGSKAAVEAITRALAKELGPRNIRVNAVSPGTVETEGSREAGIVGGGYGKTAISLTPLGRLGRPDDIAPVVAFLASDEAKWITGDVILVSALTQLIRRSRNCLNRKATQRAHTYESTGFI